MPSSSREVAAPYRGRFGIMLKSGYSFKPFRIDLPAAAPQQAFNSTAAEADRFKF
jgi:hypothetical protein